MRASMWMLAAMLVIGVPAHASDKEDAMVPVRRFVDSLDKGDMRTVTATYAPQASITDDFPPYHWLGNSALADWLRDLDAFSKKTDTADYKVTLQNPRFIEVTDDRAYIVVPASLSFRLHGKPKTEKGATMTFALQKYPDGWLISAWTWTRR